MSFRNKHRSKPGRKAQRGVALVVAMLVFALASALLVAMQKEFTLFLKRGSNIMVGEQADAYLRGGEELAALVLREDWRQDKEANLFRDTLADIWAQQVAPYALDEGGWLIGSLQDLQGRFNLNSLSERVPNDSGRSFAVRYTPAQKQFIRLLQALPGEVQVSQQEAIAITEAVMDWLDSDTEPSDSGAEDGFYYDRSPSYRVGNGPLRSVSELRAVASVTPEIFRALEPFVTVWGNEPYPINVNTASRPVLRTLNDRTDPNPLSESDVDSLLEERLEDGYPTFEAFTTAWSQLGLDPASLTELQNSLGETSSFFVFEGSVEVADRMTRLYSVLERNDQGLVVAHVRAPGGLTGEGFARYSDNTADQ